MKGRVSASAEPRLIWLTFYRNGPTPSPFRPSGVQEIDSPLSVRRISRPRRFVHVRPDRQGLDEVGDLPQRPAPADAMKERGLRSP
jgi:hypothetical protein